MYDCISIGFGSGDYVMSIHVLFFFFFNDTATTDIYTLSLHDALPICHAVINLNLSISTALYLTHWHGPAQYMLHSIQSKTTGFRNPRNRLKSAV